MPLSPDRRLQLRIAGALGLVVGVNAAVLGVLAWCAVQVWTASGYAAPTAAGLPLAVGAVVLGGVLTVVAQARYGSRTAVAGLGLDVVEDGGPRDVAGRVARLASQADVPAPSVAVAERSAATCLTVDRDGSPVVVVTTGLLDELDDDELDAALAHEVAHVANRDLPVASAVAATLSITDRLLERESRLWVILYNAAVLAAVSGVGILLFAIPVAVLSVTALVVSAAARTLLALNTVALRLFARTREYAADRGAVALTGDPGGLASALRSLDDDPPDRDLRLTASATLGIVHRSMEFDTDPDETDDEEGFVERFLVDPADDDPIHSGRRWSSDGRHEDGTGNDSDQSDAVERALRWVWATAIAPVWGRTVTPTVAALRRALRWRPSTHPDTGSRVERLRTLERARED